MSFYEETVWLVEPERGAPDTRADSKHHELQSIGRFWYQEIRDIRNSKRTVRPCGPLALIPVNGQNPKSWGEIRTEKLLQRMPLGLPGSDTNK